VGKKKMKKKSLEQIESSQNQKERMLHELDIIKGREANA